VADKGFSPGFEFSVKLSTRQRREDPRAIPHRLAQPSQRWACRASQAATSARPNHKAATCDHQPERGEMFSNGDAINQYFMWIDPVMQFIDARPEAAPHHGIAADIDDEDWP
jgi:hypothetical protein